jgi:tripartite-type tricarboxylate transporter receptor subunit TctC
LSYDLSSGPASRRRFLALGLAAALPLAARAEKAWPDHPIRLVLGVPPGGSVDTLARALGQRLGADLAAPVIVDNRPGASGKIATNYVAKSAADGYTLLSLGSSSPMSEAAAIATGTERPFDVLRDFESLGTIASNTYALAVNASLPIHDVHEFIAYAKAHPDTLNYGSAGVAKTDHVAGELFAQEAGIRIVHVPFKGLGEAITQMIAGRIQCCFSALAPMAPHIRAGKLRLLGVVSSQRSRMFPDAPTLAEAVPLPGYAVEAWIGFAAPAKTPPAVANRLYAEFTQLLKDDTFVNTMLVPNGLDPFARSPAEMAALYRHDLDKYTALFRKIHLKLD